MKAEFLDFDKMDSEVKLLFPSGLNKLKLALAPSEIVGFSIPNKALAAVSFSITVSIGNTVSKAPKALLLLNPFCQNRKTPLLLALK